MVALNLDHATLDRATDAAALLELARELLQPRIVDRHTRDSGHRLAAATRDLAPDLDAIAVGSALLELRVTRLAQVAVGRRVHDPGVLLHGSDGTGSHAAANENPSLCSRALRMSAQCCFRSGDRQPRWRC